MRPTFVHLIVGLGLGTALAVSLALPGRLVIAGKQPVHGLTLPRSGTRFVEEAAPPVRLVARRAHLEPRPALAVRSNQAPRARALPVSYAPRPRPKTQPAHRPIPAARPAAATQQPEETLAVAPGPKGDDEDEDENENENEKKKAKGKND